MIHPAFQPTKVVIFQFMTAGEHRHSRSNINDAA
jgi:hypothetical protein